MHWTFSLFVATNFLASQLRWIPFYVNVPSAFPFRGCHNSTALLQVATHPLAVSPAMATQMVQTIYSFSSGDAGPLLSSGLGVRAREPGGGTSITLTAEEAKQLEASGVMCGTMPEHLDWHPDLGSAAIPNRLVMLAVSESEDDQKAFRGMIVKSGQMPMCVRTRSV